jgi:hypothetical protein
MMMLPVVVTDVKDGSRDMKGAASIEKENHSSAVFAVDKATLNV